jgi:RNA polymerase sigma-70 factor (ECF subfamily)
MTDSTPRLCDDDISAALADLDGWTVVVAAGAVPAPHPEVVAAAVMAVRAEAEDTRVAAQRPATSVLGSTTSARQGGRRWLVGAGLVAAVTAAVVVVPSLVRAPSASAQAAALLTRAADSIHTTDPAASPGQWWRLTSSGENLSQATDLTSTALASWLVERTRVAYIAVDGSRPTVVVDAPSRVVRRLAGPAGSQAPPSDPGSTWTTGIAPSRMPANWQAPSPAFLASLPRDTAALRDRLYADTAGHGQSVDGEVVVYTADVLRSGLVPADLRSALYRVLATVPGVDVTATTVTIGGRAGVAFAYDESFGDSHSRQEIVIDPTTGDVVGERQVTLAELDGIPAGTVTELTTASRVLVEEIPVSVRAATQDQNCTLASDGGISCQPASKG